MFEQFNAGDRYYVVMEYCSRGDLLDRINQSISENKKGLGEERARRFFRMMIEGLHHIHTNGIVHRYSTKCTVILVMVELKQAQQMPVKCLKCNCELTIYMNNDLLSMCSIVACCVPLCVLFCCCCWWWWSCYFYG